VSLRSTSKRFHGGPVDNPARLVVETVDPPSLSKKRVLSAVAFTKAAIASASVGGTGGGFGVDSLPLEVPAASCDRVLDDICGNKHLETNIICQRKTIQFTLPKRVMLQTQIFFTTGYIT
jgi:hypothetical protein